MMNASWWQQAHGPGADSQQAPASDSQAKRLSVLWTLTWKTHAAPGGTLGHRSDRRLRFCGTSSTAGCTQRNCSAALVPGRRRRWRPWINATSFLRRAESTGEGRTAADERDRDERVYAHQARR